MEIERIVYNYYLIARGIEPNEIDYKRTLATANYLKDNGYSNNEILKILISCNKDAVKGDNLPEELWNDSLIEKDRFYYSDILHIKSKPPSWNPKTFKEECPSFFLEMKIKFSMNDLLNYYYDKCRIPLALQDDKKNAGAFKHLIAKYEAFKNAPGLDYVIALINKASEDKEKEMFTEVFEIESYKESVIRDFESITNESQLQGTNKVVWRN